MRPEPSLFKAVAAGAGFLAALVALVVLVLATRDAGEPNDPATSIEPACFDFATQKEAQSFYEAEGGPERDDHGLDLNGDGVACDAMLSAQAAGNVTLDDYVLTQTVTGTARATATATPFRTTAPGTTVTPTPSRVLPKSGSQSAQMAVAGMSLVTSGMFGVTVFNVRGYVVQRRRRRDEEREEERYKLIGW